MPAERTQKICRSPLDRSAGNDYNTPQSGRKQFDCSIVAHPSNKPILGIIGGIASGKSTVAAEFGKLGCAVISADALVHELLRTEPVRKQVIRLFGRGILNATGDIDRRKLAQVVFGRADCLAALNNVLHPLVLERTEELIRQYNQYPHVRAIVLDMPLLIEVGWAERCDWLIFVHADRRYRIERARQRGLMDEQEFEIRENSQISVDKKAELADNTIDNNSDFSTLVRQIQAIFSDVAGSR